MARKRGGPKLPDEIARELNKLYAQRELSGQKYDQDQCQDNWEMEKGLCHRGYKYGTPGWQGCNDRANYRHMLCSQRGDYNGVPVWTLHDVTGQPSGADDPDRRAKPTSPPQEAEPDESDERTRVPDNFIDFLLWNPAREAVGGRSLTLGDFVVPQDQYFGTSPNSTLVAPPPAWYLLLGR